MNRLYFLIICYFSGLLACVQESTPTKQNPSRPPIQQPSGSDSEGDDGSGDSFSDGFFTDAIDTGGTDSEGDGTDPESPTGTSGTGKTSAGGPPIPNGDPNQVIYLKGSIGSYLSPMQNNPKGAVSYHCPGDSFLAGEKSEWNNDDNNRDRTYQFRCQFLTDGQGVLIRKSECSLSDPISDTVLDYSCPDDKYLAGQVSSYNEQSKDRVFQYECCEARSEQSGEKLTSNFETLQTGQELEMCASNEAEIPAATGAFPGFKPNIEVNKRMSELDYNCTGAGLLPLGGLVVNFEVLPIPNAILKRVKSTFYPDVQDRRHSFYCCQLKVDSDK
ncbi:MAG: hypothetical protein AB8G05_14910 [Oligoflexales bacterium]